MELAQQHALSLRGEKVYACECADADCPYHRERWEQAEPARAGDTWRCRWYRPPGEPEGPIAGYWICCPRCGDIHPWTTANNCKSRRELRSETGELQGYTCDHSGKFSCWTWTGSAEENTLDAKASLLCHSCGYHGWLNAGVLIDA
ncbi:MAG: hypothetical protein ACREIB_00230 [Pseudomonadota bacterium]